MPKAPFHPALPSCTQGKHWFTEPREPSIVDPLLRRTFMIGFLWLGEFGYRTFSFKMSWSLVNQDRL